MAASVCLQNGVAELPLDCRKGRFNVAALVVFRHVLFLVKPEEVVRLFEQAARRAVVV